MDDQLSVAVEDQADDFKESSCRVGADHQPPSGVVFIIEGTRMQHVGGGVEDRRIIEAVASVVLACGLMQLRQRRPRTALPPGSPLSGW